MSLSLFRSSTSVARVALVALVALAASLPACSDDTCGPKGASDTGLLASSTDVTLTFGRLTSRAGNDCPDSSAPDIIALTIEGQQTDGTGFITLCIPRPDLLADGNRSIGFTTSMSDIRIVDLQGTANNCMYSVDKTRPPTGTGGAAGICSNGTDKAGFAIDFDGALSLTRKCGSTTDSVAVKLTGPAAVAAE